MTPERRKFIRMPTKFTTRYTIVESGKVRRALTKNIGGGGICFVAEEALEPGTALEIEMKFPDRDKPVTVNAEVVWSKPIDAAQASYKNPTSEVGVRIVKISEQDRAALLHYVASNPSLAVGGETGEPPGSV